MVVVPRKYPQAVPWKKILACERQQEHEEGVCKQKRKNERERQRHLLHEIESVSTKSWHGLLIKQSARFLDSQHSNAFRGRESVKPWVTRLPTKCLNRLTRS